MGLIAPHVLWLALRAIYGLRKAPKLWEEERNRMLDHRVVNTSIGSVVMQPLESGAWLLQADGECVGLFMMYVDDGLLVGPREVLVSLGAELKTLWDLKCQGFLASHALGSESVVPVGDESVPVQQELNFLGVKIRRCPDNWCTFTSNVLADPRIEQARLASHERQSLTACCSRRNVGANDPRSAVH